MEKRREKIFADKSSRCHLLWAITSKCGLSCRHCFLTKKEKKHDLSYSKCLKILSDFREFITQNNMDGLIAFTGGDPFLRKDFWDILEVAGEYQKTGSVKFIRILGNPEAINKETANRIKSLADVTYKLSVDGLKNTHDSMRRRGSFQKTIEALDLLRKSGVDISVCFTLCRSNASDLPKVIRLMVDKKIREFTFHAFKPKGKGRDLKKELLSPDEYREVLMEVLSLLDSLKSENKLMVDSVISGETLFSRLFYELGRLDQYKRAEFRRTQGVNWLAFSVLPDGTVYPRRLTPIKIGKVPRDSFQKIYDSSNLLKDVNTKRYIKKKKDNNQKCRKCPAVNHCGLAGEYVHHNQNNIFGPHVMCWVK